MAQRFRENLIPSSRIEAEGLNAQIILEEIDTVAQWYEGQTEAYTN